MRRFNADDEREGPGPHRRRGQGVLRGRRPQGDGQRRAADPAARLPAPVRPQHRRAQAHHRRGQRGGLRGRVRAGPAVRPVPGRRARPVRHHRGQGGPGRAVGRAAALADPAPGGHADPAHRRPGHAPSGRTRSAWSTTSCRPPSWPRRRSSLAERIAANAPLSVLAAKRTVRLVAEQPLAAAFEEADQIWAPVYRSEDAQEGPAAFRRQAAARLEGALTGARRPGRAARRPGRRDRGAGQPGGPAGRRPAGAAPTPAPGWSIHDQVTHLAYFDETAALAATDPDRFRAEAAELMLLGGTFPDEIARRHRRAAAGRRAGLVPPRPGRLPGHVPRPGPAAAAALVRPGHERGQLGHRAADGDLGARPGHRRHARRVRAHRPRGCGTWRTSASAPSTSPSS